MVAYNRAYRLMASTSTIIALCHAHARSGVEWWLRCHEPESGAIAFPWECRW